MTLRETFSYVLSFSYSDSSLLLLPLSVNTVIYLYSWIDRHNDMLLIHLFAPLPSLSPTWPTIAMSTIHFHPEFAFNDSSPIPILLTLSNHPLYSVHLYVFFFWLTGTWYSPMRVSSVYAWVCLCPRIALFRSIIKVRAFSFTFK